MIGGCTAVPGKLINKLPGTGPLRATNAGGAIKRSGMIGFA
jgi:hypothetical protein